MFNKNEIEFRFNEHIYGKKFRHICEVYPIISARKAEKSWWKKMKAHYDVRFSDRIKEFTGIAPTMKYCPGIYDFTNYGYIVPAWQDFEFLVNNNGDVEWVVPPEMHDVKNIRIHEKAQMDTSPILGETANCILTLIAPWYISTPKGTSIMVCKPFYDYSNDFDVCPGVLDTDIDSNGNHIVDAFLRFNVRNKVIRIKAGQPLIQILPFKRTNWTLKYVELEDLPVWVKNDNIKLQTRFESRTDDKNSMTKYRQDDSDKKFEVIPTLNGCPIDREVQMHGFPTDTNKKFD